MARKALFSCEISNSEQIRAFASNLAQLLLARKMLFLYAKRIGCEDAALEMLLGEGSQVTHQEVERMLRSYWDMTRSFNLILEEEVPQTANA